MEHPGNNGNTPVVSFVARSGSGKTTLLEKVVRQFKAEGYRISVIKHGSDRFQMDTPGKDTWRMAQAGADIVAICSSGKLAVIEKLQAERTLDDIIKMISGVDLILTEGFKASGKPCIEVFRSAVHRDLLPGPIQRLAIASDIKWDMDVPCYDLNDVDGIVGEIKSYMSRFNSSLP